MIKASFGLESMQQLVINRKDLHSCARALISSLTPQIFVFIIITFI